MASRRKSDELVATGKVKLNGKMVTELGTTIDPHVDVVEVGGKRVQITDENIYMVLNKPRGVLSTLEDPLERPTIQDLLPEDVKGLFPVGRLDWDSEGMILITNDGDFANRISHPKWGVPKTYLVKVNGQPTDRDLQKLVTGVSIIGGKVSAQEIQKIKRGADKYDWIKITITEGKNRQIRRMFEKINFDVLKLQRVAIGGLSIGKLGKGELKVLNETSLKKLFSYNKEMAKTKTRKPRQKSKKRI